MIEVQNFTVSRMLTFALFFLVQFTSEAVSLPTIYERLLNATNGDSNVRDVGNGKVVFDLDILCPKEEFEARFGSSEKRTKRKAIDLTMFTGNKWTNGEIPYVLQDNTFSTAEVDVIQSGFDEWTNYTCLTFIPRTSQSYYVRIIKDSGCYSFVGRVSIGSQPQDLSLGSGCVYTDIVSHELGHAAGLWHEQSRPDRDNYVTINSMNINSQRIFNFEKKPSDQVNYYTVPYDYYSIMHYTKNAFSINGQDTITTVDPAFQDIIGQGTRLSFADVKIINLAYGCAAQASCQAVSCPGEGFQAKDCLCYCPSQTQGTDDPVILCSPDDPTTTVKTATNTSTTTETIPDTTTTTETIPDTTTTTETIPDTTTTTETIPDTTTTTETIPDTATTTETIPDTTTTTETIPDTVTTTETIPDTTTTTETIPDTVTTTETIPDTTTTTETIPDATKTTETIPDTTTTTGTIPDTTTTTETIPDTVTTTETIPDATKTTETIPDTTTTTGTIPDTTTTTETIPDTTTTTETIIDTTTTTETIPDTTTTTETIPDTTTTETIPDTTTTTLRVTTIATSYTTEGICEDQLVACRIWARLKFCDRYASFMQANCPVSCGMCTPTACTDKSRFCSRWTWACNRRIYSRIMTTNCVKTCGVCT